MATITGTYSSGQVTRTQTWKTGTYTLQYWNDSTKHGSNYLSNAAIANIIAGTASFSSNLLTLVWPDPINPTVEGQYQSNIERYDIDSERYFRLETETVLRPSVFTERYQILLTLRCIYQNHDALVSSMDITFKPTDWPEVLSNGGGGMLNSFSKVLSNPAWYIYSYPLNSPIEEYSDYNEYTKGYAVEHLYTGTYTDGRTTGYAYRTGSAGVKGSELTYVNSGNAWWLHFIWDIKEPKIPTSEPDEDFGGYGNESDPGEIPGVPGVDMVLTGLVRLYQPTAGQMVDFSNFLWAVDFTDWQKIMNSLKQWFSSPLESIISVNLLPIDYFYNYDTGAAITPSAAAIVMGGYNTGCVAPPCGGNFKQVNCGTIHLAPYFRSFLDCNPFTKYTIYLPYVGFREIDSNLLYSPDGADLQVVYNVDIITGVFTCLLKIAKTNAGTELSHVLYTYSGNMATQVPLSAANMNDFIRTLGQAAASVGMAAITGGASVAGQALLGATANAASGMAASDFNISHGGNVSMESGYLGIQYPYLIVERPRESYPDGYMHILGKPSDIGGKLSDFSGFVAVKECHLDGVPATDDEKNEIMNLLQQGVIV
jgi:hypothetical protein